MRKDGLQKCVSVCVCQHQKYHTLLLPGLQTSTSHLAVTLSSLSDVICRVSEGPQSVLDPVVGLGHSSNGPLMGLITGIICCSDALVSNRVRDGGGGGSPGLCEEAAVRVNERMELWLLG